MPPRPAGRDTKPFPGTFLLSAPGLQFVCLGHKDGKQREGDLLRGQFRAGTGAGSTMGALNRDVRMGRTACQPSLCPPTARNVGAATKTSQESRTGNGIHRAKMWSPFRDKAQHQYFFIVLASKSILLKTEGKRKNIKNNKGTFDLQDVKTWILKWNMVGFCPICLCFLSPHDITSQQSTLLEV